MSTFTSSITATRRRFAALALLLTMPLAAFAQPAAWPAEPITAVVPFSPGGSVDVAARLLMPKLAERLKQTIVIENTVGASGTIATQRVIRAKADGTTMLFGVASPVSVAPLVSPNVYKYDALKELTPVVPVAASPFVLVGRPDLPARTAAELVKLVRSQPGKINFGTDGVGTGLHVTAEMIKQQAGLDMVHVPYKSGPQVLTELAGGQIDLAVLPVALVQAFIRDGKVRGYGVTSRQRWATLPDVPSLSETAEFKTLDVESWQGLLVPAKTDPAIVERIAREMTAVLADPDTVRRLAEAGFKPMTMTPAQFATYLAEERRDLARIIAAAGIKVE
ncbi:Bug family tripartite tricarboxylate transporter substrate binding protein [Variovorax arabinosiphilus]|uniref:Bug family tripartite tricarboxylate transporter substrate binding protein n=1 Tax=Variovorax arabinosiphilus TaxID=3053498 RepID=UPI0025788B30|nr:MULTISPECIES: tripartite tricarboxylate transporter substrate binding protein [unclassified Variovorax]MDM0121404.1 tripartite tricarboxylate transporter substrate binding protein [Variovorax sp. J2L1-78]MDM0130465.1 tripartite tricarboxylate transporter substrate binding protein [Variovorax sp. J2L1-63]MDM0234167.1 tripartite tricarboxylate transporter substrate binding protein [Variovorax sp. J2R1-6]